MTELSVIDGYSKWAEAYDGPGNPLIRLETACLTRTLADLSPTSVLDVGTGTGRHALAFAQRGATVVGVDASAAMLAVADRKRESLGLDNVRFLQANIDSGLPVSSASFDLGICALATCHVVNLEGAIALLVDAVRPGGDVIITDLHPEAVAAGLGTIFTVDGTQHSIATAKHTRDRYFNALRLAGASGLTVQERKLGEAVSTAAGLPSAVARGDWRNLLFCFVITAHRP